MAKKQDPRLSQALALFDELPLHEQRDFLLELQNLHQEGLNKRRRELLDELHALGTKPEPGSGADGSNALLVARYRSKKNPLLVWSGRGRMARWLVQEMKETGLSKEAFRVV